MKYMELEQLRQQAEALLSGAYGGPVQLRADAQLESDHMVARCSILTAPHAARLPASVILKHRIANNPKASQAFDQQALFLNEWAGLAFLTEVAPNGSLAPRVVASDTQASLIVIEDLGTVQTVEQILFGDNQQRAAAALVGMGRSLGAVQRAALAHEPLFLAHQAALGAHTETSDATFDARSNLASLLDCAAALEIEAQAQLSDAIHEVEAATHGPGPFRGFAHNDAGPHNFLEVGGQVRPIDFEFCGYGSALTDVVGARLAFPQTANSQVVPESLARQFEDAYRAEIVGCVPEAADDRLFERAVALACAHWSLSRLSGFWRSYLRERLAEGEAVDSRRRTPERTARYRRQVLTYLRLIVSALERSSQRPALYAPLAQIVDRLLEIWPDTPMLSIYPALDRS